MSRQNPLRPPQLSLDVLAEIHRAADQGIYEIRGFGTKRSLPNFDDLLFLGASMSAIPGRLSREVRHRCHPRNPVREKPIELKIPITIAA